MLGADEARDLLLMLGVLLALGVALMMVLMLWEERTEGEGDGGRGASLSALSTPTTRSPPLTRSLPLSSSPPRPLPRPARPSRRRWMRSLYDSRGAPCVQSA